MNLKILECNCNEHSESCVYSPFISGDICTNCRDNTKGRQCESCQESFYQDPELPLNHKQICKKCDCDPQGTLDNGVCDPFADELENMVAGRCHCKKLTEGDRCDRCMSGYGNLTKENNEGCQGTRSRDKRAI